jgi:hypothetical protein
VNATYNPRTADMANLYNARFVKHNFLYILTSKARRDSFFNQNQRASRFKA